MKTALYTTKYLDYLGKDNQMPQSGAIFGYLRSKLQKYYYGVVVNNNMIHVTMPEDRRMHLQFYNYYMA